MCRDCRQRTVAKLTNQNRLYRYPPRLDPAGVIWSTRAHGNLPRIFGTRDNSIPANLLAFMAERARSKKTVTIEGASHAVLMSHADAVVELVEQAA
jgi:pimeloyl-ACP methyl ester carboxylesterase